MYIYSYKRQYYMLLVSLVCGRAVECIIACWSVFFFFFFFFFCDVVWECVFGLGCTVCGGSD